MAYYNPTTLGVRKNSWNGFLILTDKKLQYFLQALYYFVILILFTATAAPSGGF
jgi:hypothetical protein